ncbi:MAG: YceI family protein [Desulfohalobiaceae bacterium]|nr:YceI family protein [Desulfohalobiaceae bacterium]
MQGRIMIIFFVCFFLPATLWAKAPEWRIDPPHSSVYFDIRHIFSTVRGEFQDFSGTFRFDPDDLQASAMSFTVEAASIDTRNRNRDNHLRSDDFFHVSEYPEISFQSSNISHLQDQKYEVTGTLKVKDVSRTISLPFTYFGTTKSPLEKNTIVAGFEGIFTIDRLEYHVGTGKFFKLGVVGDEVRLLITLEMQRDED